MKDLFKKIQKFMPPRGTPRWMLDPGPLGSPTATLYEVIGEVEMNLAMQTCARSSQPAGTSRPQESGKVPDMEQTPIPEWTHSSHVRRKSTKRLARSGHGPSPGKARASKKSRTLEKARTPERTRMPERAKTPDRGKALVAQASPPLAPDCMIVDRWVPLPFQGMSARERHTASASWGRNREWTVENDHSPRQGARKKKLVVAAERSGSGDGSWEEESCR